MFAVISTALPQVKAGKVKALAVASAQRSPAMPQLPTISEAGVPGYEASTWYGVLTPAGSPKRVITKLHDEVVNVLRVADVHERLAGLGFETIGNTPEQFASYIKTEIAKWAQVVKQSGARAD
jgi:tripartite-type tricarboxylate transporter receptor subunit TctC